MTTKLKLKLVRPGDHRCHVRSARRQRCPARTQQVQVSAPPAHGGQSGDTNAGRLRLPYGLRMPANAPPWRGGDSTSMSELVPPRSA